MNIHSASSMATARTESAAKAGGTKGAAKVEGPPNVDQGPFMGSRKRAAVMMAGLELFAERGFHGTTVPALAAKAHVGAGTFYRYFPSKEALVNELYQYWKTEYAHALLDNVRFAGSARSLFHEIWTRLRAFASNNPKVLDFLDLHHHGSYLDEESRRVERGVLAKLKLFVEEAQRNQVLRRVSSPVLVAVVWGAFNGLFRAGADGYLKLDQKTYDEAEEAVWSAIRV
jgi:TetR/AcrR family transcriptional regulator, repressor of fatR-cypB operon